MAIDFSSLNANVAGLKKNGFSVPIEIAPQVSTSADVGWLPAAPVANSAAELALAPPIQQPAPGVVNPLLAAVQGPSAAAPPVAPPSPALIPGVPVVEDLGGDTAPSSPQDIAAHAAAAKKMGLAPGAPMPGSAGAPTVAAPPAAPAPAPAAVGGDPAPAPHPLTFADKESAVWLPGQKEAFQNEKEYLTSQAINDDMIRDKNLEIEAHVNEMNAQALESQEAALAKEKADREEFEGYMSAEQAKLAAHSDKIANTTMDPNRLFKGEKGWLAVTAAVAASVFGIFGAPATGGKNVGVESVNNAINRDLELQARDLENQKQGVARKSTLLAQKYAIFGDKQRAMAAARIDAWKLAMAKAESYAASSGQEVHVLQAVKVREAGEREIARAQEKWGIDTEAGWAQIKAKKDAEDARARLNAQAKVDKYTDKIMDVELGAAKSVAEAYGKAGQQVNVVVENNHVKVVDPVTGKQLWDGSGVAGGPDGKSPTVSVPGSMNAAGQWSVSGVAPAHNPEAANKFNEVTDAAKKGKAIVAELKALREKYGGGAVLPSGEDKARAEFLQRELFKAGKTAGENSDKDAERIEKTIPSTFDLDPKSAVLGGKPYTDALIDQWDKKFDSDIERAKGTYLKKPPPAPAPLTAPPKASK